MVNKERELAYSVQQVATREDDRVRLATPRVNCRRVVLTETLPEDCIRIRDDQGPFDPRLGLGSLRVGASGAHLVSQDTNLGREDPCVMHHYANEGLRDARGANVGSSLYDHAADVGSSLYARAADVGSNLYDRAADVGSSLYDRAADVGSSLYDLAADVGSSWYDRAADVGSSLYDRAADVGSSLYDRGADVGLNAAREVDLRPRSRTTYDAALRVAHDAGAGMRLASDDEIRMSVVCDGDDLRPSLRAARDDVGLSVVHDTDVVQCSRFSCDDDVRQRVASDDDVRLKTAHNSDLRPSSRTARDEVGLSVACGADVVPFPRFVYDDVKERAAHDDDARLRDDHNDDARLRAAFADDARLRVACAEDARLSAVCADDARLRAACAEDARLRAVCDDDARLRDDHNDDARLRAACVGDVGLRDGEIGLKDALDLVYTGSDALWPCNLADLDARLLSDAGLVVQPEVASLPIPSFNGPLLEDLMLKEEYGCDFLRPVKARHADEISAERQPRLKDGTWSHYDKLTSDPSAKEEKKQQKIKKAKAGKTKKRKELRDAEVKNELAETR